MRIANLQCIKWLGHFLRQISNLAKRQVSVVLIEE